MIQSLSSKLTPENIRSILIGENHSAHQYIDRLLVTLVDIAHVGNQQQNLAKFQSLVRESVLAIVDFLEIEIIRSDFRREEIPTNLASLKEVLLSGKNLINSMLTLPLDPESTSEMALDYINLLYHYSHEFHLLLKSVGGYDVPLPRVGIPARSMNDVERMNDKQRPPLFHLEIDIHWGDQEKTDSEIGQNGHILALEEQRGKKYYLHIKNGQQAMVHKNFELAEKTFAQASQVKTTAEALTFLAWAQASLGNFESAKNNCIKAITVDADYGPAYNDLGSYLYRESRLEEALKWFTIAKRAPVYENREYPYINSARIFLAKGNVEMALEEYQKAYTLAPFNTELSDTIIKLQDLLTKEKMQQSILLPRLQQAGQKLPMAHQNEIKILSEIKNVDKNVEKNEDKNLMQETSNVLLFNENGRRIMEGKRLPDPKH